MTSEGGFQVHVDPALPDHVGLVRAASRARIVLKETLGMLRVRRLCHSHRFPDEGLAVQAESHGLRVLAKNLRDRVPALQQT